MFVQENPDRKKSYNNNNNNNNNDKDYMENKQKYSIDFTGYYRLT